MLQLEVDMDYDMLCASANRRIGLVSKTITFLWLSLTPFITLAQRDIEPRLIYTDTSNYQFTGEWQYLSTDIYLFNGEKFSNLINELDFARTKPRGGAFRKKGLAEEYLEYLFITASLKNVKFFGDNDITYPLYNFQISRDKENKYQTFVSDNIDHIRIIDNLPLYSARDYIDAEIRVRALTNSDRDQILGLVAAQLKNISKILTPTDAVMSIVGEFGNFIESSTRKKEYKFSSTIRLFEQKNFDTRLHSIKVYALTTSNSRFVQFDTHPLSNLLDTIDHALLNRQMLMGLIDYTEYPLIVVANYKSLYRMEQVSGDEVTFANIEKRKLKIENDFRAGLINAETYRQEKDFVGYLTVFANFKNHLDVYSLNYKTGNTDAISGSLFRLMQYYRQLIKTHEELKFKYRGNTAFQSVFSREYESILGYASLYLDDDHNLKSLKELVRTLVSIESKPDNTANDQLESSIAALRFSDVFKPELMSQNMEGQLITTHLRRLEELLYKSVFEKEVLKLAETEASGVTTNAPAKLMALLKNTSCGVCRERGLAGIREFNQRMEEHNRKKELSRRDSLVAALQPWIFVQLEKIQMIRANLASIYSPGEPSESMKYLSTKVGEAERDVRNIQDFSRIDVSTKDLATVANLNQKLLQLRRQVADALALVCELKPDLCSALPRQQAEATPNGNLTKLFAPADSVVRQANIFISIFDYQVNRFRKVVPNNQLTPDQLSLVAQIDRGLGKVRIAVELMGTIKTRNETYISLEREINQLIRDISGWLIQLTEDNAGARNPARIP
jgi:hypothetical protein